LLHWLIYTKNKIGRAWCRSDFALPLCLPFRI